MGDQGYEIAREVSARQCPIRAGTSVAERDEREHQRMIVWQTYPKSGPTPVATRLVIAVFEAELVSIDSESTNLKSDQVLAILAEGLRALNFVVEEGKAHANQIKLPVLYGQNDAVQKSFDADAFHSASGTVLEVEAGRGYANNQFLKDLFQACMMPDAKHLAIAVRNDYRDSRDFFKVVNWFDTLYTSGRLTLPLATVTVIGY